MYEMTQSRCPAIQEDAEALCTTVSHIEAKCSTRIDNRISLAPTKTEAEPRLRPTHNSSATTEGIQNQSAAAILKSCRRAAEQAEGKHPIVPTRSTSMRRPAKRKRHEDYVAFHRNSCQLFTSIDGALAQIRQNVVSSPSSSSSCSSSSSSSSSPISRSSTRNTSLDYDSSNSVPDPISIDNDGVRNSTKNSQPKRPTLQRMPCSFSSSSTLTSVNTPPNFALEPNDTEQVPQPSIDPCIAKSRPSITTTRSYYSSQTILSLPLTSNHPTTTTIQWTSPETRQREYAKIDAANSGFRLFLRRVFPRGLGRKVGGGRAGFWNERAANDDVDQRSVRRFRIDDHEDGNEAPDEGDDGRDEKGQTTGFMGITCDSRTTTGLSFVSSTLSTTTSSLMKWKRVKTGKSEGDISSAKAKKEEKKAEKSLLTRLVTCHS